MAKNTKQGGDAVAPDDGGLEKAIGDYQRAGGAGSPDGAAKELAGKIAKVSATQDERLKKARPQLSRTSNR